MIEFLIAASENPSQGRFRIELTFAVEFGEAVSTLKSPVKVLGLLVHLLEEANLLDDDGPGKNREKQENHENSLSNGTTHRDQ
jgi:hypothetical protein